MRHVVLCGVIRYQEEEEEKEEQRGSLRSSAAADIGITGRAVEKVGPRGLASHERSSRADGRRSTGCVNLAEARLPLRSRGRARPAVRAESDMGPGCR